MIINRLMEMARDILQPCHRRAPAEFNAIFWPNATANFLEQLDRPEDGQRIADIGWSSEKLEYSRLQRSKLLQKSTSNVIVLGRLSFAHQRWRCDSDSLWMQNVSEQYYKGAFSRRISCRRGYRPE